MTKFILLDNGLNLEGIDKYVFLPINTAFLLEAYSIAFTNSVGCDSIANINFTLNNISAINNHNTDKRILIKKIDVLGREVPIKKNIPMFYIYNDGTVDKRIVVE